MSKDYRIIHVDCLWDEEACVWIATSPEVKGLVLEDESLDRLMKRVPEAVPELLELNNQPRFSDIMLRAERKQVVIA